MEMAIVHDAPEAVAGDVIPADNMTPETKQRREQLGLEYLACLARDSGLDAFADRLAALWNEYEEQKSVVSQVVHQVDKFQALAQAYLYSRRYPKLTKLADFRHLHAKLQDPWLVRQADDILCKWDEADSNQTSDMVFVLVIGGPGVGKGTQCEQAARNFGFGHISVGNLLRRESTRSGSLYRGFIDKSFREHVPVPPSLAMRLLREELPKLEADGNKIRGLILDGFPLTEEQLKAFEEEVSTQYSTVVMQCPPEVLRERLIERARTSNREDDEVDRIKKRVASFEESDSATLMGQLSKNPKNPVYKIDCARSIEEVKTDFWKCVQSSIDQAGRGS
ncbi:hypothetical protein N0V88_000709 [Collariella sp. IMI 366227]|nr:hypothetical protein N0V88_000709 [Collariella sp. IMI 366227]